KESFVTWDNFKYMFNGRNSLYGVNWGNPRAEVPEILKRVCLRRQRKDVLPDLPEKTYNNIQVELDLVKDREAIQVANEIEEAIVKNGISDEDLLKGEGIEFETMARARRLLATAKIDSMLEMIEEYEEAEQPVVVFSAHRDPVEVFRNREGWAIINGDTTPENRTKIENDFQSGKLKGVACTIKAGGVSITLTNAHIAIFTDLEWTPALNLQAEDRICRIGQTRGVIVNKLVVNHPLDNRIANILAKKQNLISKSGL
ncbi:MAG: DEAD/DEAH box helicase, partial [Alphaproteobacteria bacterium]|nr:DEAD/DEAH box helicase [Alphaproteobacteria bacterium]